MFQKIKHFFITLFHFLLNPRFLVCFGIGWIITNGWSYIMFGFGTYFQIEWMIAVSAAYLAFLWLPISPEKIVTFAIAVFFMKWLFPNDKKTLGILKKGYEKAKSVIKRKKEKQEKWRQIKARRKAKVKVKTKKKTKMNKKRARRSSVLSRRFSRK